MTGLKPVREDTSQSLKLNVSILPSKDFLLFSFFRLKKEFLNMCDSVYPQNFFQALCWLKKHSPRPWSLLFSLFYSLSLPLPPSFSLYPATSCSSVRSTLQVHRSHPQCKLTLVHLPWDDKMQYNSSSN